MKCSHNYKVFCKYKSDPAKFLLFFVATMYSMKCVSYFSVSTDLIHGSFNTLFDLSDNPLLSSKVTVTIKVLDVNEFPPELAFIYETFVCENAKVGQVSMCVCEYLPVLQFEFLGLLLGAAVN